MPRRKLEVLLVGAKGLEDSDFLGDMDPFVILTCQTQEHKSTIASGMGAEPKWNQTFVFTISDSITKLEVKIMDSDGTTDDDFVGKTIIDLEPLFMAGHLVPAPYNVVNIDLEYKGEIRIGLAFFPSEDSCDGELDATENYY